MGSGPWLEPLTPFLPLATPTMTLVQAPTLGIARYANDRNKESWSHASDNDKNVIIRAVYRQVLG